MKLKLSGVLLIASVLGLSVGCTLPSSRRTIPASQANTVQHVELGTVTGVREVNIEGQKSNLGMFGGGLVGGAAASGGRGVTGAVVQAGGSVVGAVAGQAIEEGVTRKRAQEISIRLDDGSNVVITQEASGGLFRDGDRVRILNGGGGARVAMDAGN